MGKKKSNLRSEKTTLNSKYEGKDGIILGRCEDMPDHSRQNEYIKTGYRLNCNSIKKSIKSLFILHNESVKVWSHLIGAFIFIILIFYTLKFITNYSTQLMFVRKNILDLEQTKKIFQSG